MYQIKLVLADFDGSYLDRVTGFINSSSFCAGIRVSSFTEVQRLADFLAPGGEKADILLAHPGFIDAMPDLRSCFELVVILADGRVNSGLQDYQTVFKYQPGDKMLGRILEMYAERNPKAAKAVAGTKESRLVTVYSPAGGVGKTSAAFALASRMGDYGSSVLYLNWESINSMAAVLPGTGECGMTRVLLGLGEDPDTLPLKFELYKKRSSEFNLDFFEPPESFVEYSEIQGDFGLLFTKLKETGMYDIIVADLDSAINGSAVRILGLSDHIVLMVAADQVCRYKTGEFFRQAGHSGLFPGMIDPVKLFPVANKTGSGGILPPDEYGLPDIHNLPNEYGLPDKTGLPVRFAVPYIPDLWTSNEGKFSFDTGQVFRSAIDPLARMLISGQG
ncbi:hypothetical protein [Phosphitispora fastidiosa]|uniref:hypothetical protein n=1 Tax=Phosphitispora fastidiosa TaxID=2837202 RepID=UPI001E3F2410|nr:hypothetical protein [Phosphitispora fastidiosa]MBU7007193.1 hypothetical protein [Phosphitispora fastidiosa]